MFFLVIALFTLVLFIAALIFLQKEAKKSASLERSASALEASLQALRVNLADQGREVLRLKEENRWKDLILRGSARELREHVQSLGTLAEDLVERGGKAEPRDFEYLEMAVRKFQDSASAVLEYSRFSDPLFSLDFRPVDLESLVRELAAELSAQPQPLYLDLDCPSIPPVWADPPKIRQVLRSLVEAAAGSAGKNRAVLQARLEHSGPGPVMISLKAGDPGNSSALILGLEEWNRMSDHGVERGPRDLGLPIAQKLVSLHGGALEIRSPRDFAVELWFSLPQAPRHEGLPEPESAGTEALPFLPAMEEVSLRDASRESVILIVDDDPVNLHLMARNLAAGGYRSIPVDSGEKALELLGDSLRPELIVLDLLMPGMGGLETLRTLRKSFPAETLPVLLLTAKNQVTDIVEGFEAGANDFISKPVGKRELLARIRTHLQLAGMAQAYGRFVPPQLLRLLRKDSVLDLALGDFSQQEMTVLFCDLRNFTSLSETMTSRETFRFINSFYAAMTPAVSGHRGYVDKYLGDGFMALFPGTPENGLLAAMEMQARLKDLNQARVARGRMPLEMGVGVHTGEVILGVVGSHGRMEGTVISDAVNMASRLESQTKAYGCQILVSRDALFSVRDISRYCYRFLGNEFLKGKQQSVAIYELFEDDGTPLNSWKKTSKDRFEQSLLLFSRGQLEDAREFLQRLHDEFPGDRVIASFLNRCRRGN